MTAATAYAVLPSQALSALPPLTEPMYALAVAAMVRLALARIRPAVLAGAAVGLAVAAAQYVRATAPPLLGAAVLLPFLTRTALRRAAAFGGAAVVAFLIAMLPVVGFNLRNHGDISVSTSAYAGWSLFVGANQSSAGRFNAEDSRLFADLPGSSAWERSERAGALGVRRILDDPVGYLALQPRKFAVLWGDETYAGSYAFAPEGATAPAPTQSAWLLSQLFYVPVILLALGEVRRGRRRPRPAVLLIGMSLLVVTASHALLEVHSRYHSYLLPLLVVLAAGGAHALPGVASSVRRRIGPRRGHGPERGRGGGIPGERPVSRVLSRTDATHRPRTAIHLRDLPGS